MVGKLLLKYALRPLLIEAAAEVGKAIGGRLARKIDPDAYVELEIVDEDAPDEEDESPPPTD